MQLSCRRAAAFSLSSLAFATFRQVDRTFRVRNSCTLDISVRFTWLTAAYLRLYCDGATAVRQPSNRRPTVRSWPRVLHFRPYCTRSLLPGEPARLQKAGQPVNNGPRAGGLTTFLQCQGSFMQVLCGHQDAVFHIELLGSGFLVMTSFLPLLGGQKTVPGMSYGP